MSELPPAQPDQSGPTPNPPRFPDRAGLPTVAKVLLFAVLPVIIAVALVVAVLGAVVPQATSTDQQMELDAGEQVRVDVRNAVLEFVPSADDRIHVEVRGFSWGGRPPLQTDDSGSVTEITGGCRGGLMMMCRMSIEVAMPADLPLEAHGSNGRITVDDLTGELELRTSNGAVEVNNSSGPLTIRTSNGSIDVEESRSGLVEAATSNGQITLEFDRAPRTVVATSSNGAISVRVPGDGQQYRLNADTVNGRVDTESVPTDSNSTRSISVSTTNGAVTIETDD